MPVVRAHGVRLDRVRFSAARLNKVKEGRSRQIDLLASEIECRSLRFSANGGKPREAGLQSARRKPSRVEADSRRPDINKTKNAFGYERFMVPFST